MDEEDPKCHVCRGPLNMEHYAALICPLPTPLPPPEDKKH